MESFNFIKPSSFLAPYVKHYWMLTMNPINIHIERIIPTGHTSLIFHRQQQMLSSSDRILLPRSFISGTSSSFFDIASTGAIDMIVVEFEPHGANVFFKIPMSKLNNSYISVQDIGIKTLIELEDKIQNTIDNITCIKLIEEYLTKQLLSSNLDKYKRINATISVINRKSNINIKSLSEIACLSYKQFNRIFTETVGTSPKEFSRVIRFQRALYFIQTNHSISLTQIALECGYYDQPHLIREFKYFSGYTPSEYLAICTPYSDYFTKI